MRFPTDCYIEGRNVALFGTVQLNNIFKVGNRIIYDYSVSEKIRKYFTDYPFWIEYSENIESVPNAISTVPFVCNVLPIIWITGSTLYIPELDETFYNCLVDVKKGYKKMFPETEWKGSVEVGKIVPNNKKAEPGKSAMFYSGGLDSVQTLITHFEEKPILISVWGSDIKTDNTEGWKILHKTIEEVACRFQLDDITVRSAFRAFDNEGELSRDFSRQLKDGWWHGVKHGLGLLGHVAPLAYLYHLQTMYIAASHSLEDGHVRCASNPIIDNNVRFVDCQVVHDGFELNRQAKTANIVDFSRRNAPLNIHVCYKTQTGMNCCRCEKCYRTIIGLLVEGADPGVYGFNEYKQYIRSSEYVVISNVNADLCKEWKNIKRKMTQKRDDLINSPDWKKTKWVLKTDFEHPETIKVSLYQRIRDTKGLKGKLSQLWIYQELSKMKRKLWRT